MVFGFQVRKKKKDISLRKILQDFLFYFFLFFFLRNWPLTTKTQSFLSPRMEIDSVSVRVDFNSHREKIETNSALVLPASLTGLFLGCVFELLTLDWMVWEATNEHLQFWHKGWKQLCCYTPTPSTAKTLLLCGHSN